MRLWLAGGPASRALRASLAALALSAASLGAGPAAHAQTEEELDAARKTFADALADEQHKRYEAALEKFEKVRTVRDTPQVRYRIGSCYEALGRAPQAWTAYDAATRAGTTDADTMEVVRAARARLDALSKRVARIRVSLAERAPPDAEVRVDGEPVGAAALGQPLALDPGEHTITGTAPGAAPFRATVTLTPGGEATMTVTLDASTIPPAPAPPLPPAPPPDAPTAAPPTTPRTLAIVLLGSGGALFAGGVISLVLQHQDIQDLRRSCPGSHCPWDQRAALTSERSRALVEGPLGYGLGAAGLVAAGVGTYLFARPSPSVTPVVTRDGLSVLVTGAF